MNWKTWLHSLVAAAIGGASNAMLGAVAMPETFNFTHQGWENLAKLAIMGLGLIIAGSMHCVFMMQLVRRTGRSFWPWFIAIVIFMPVGTAVLLAMLLGDADAAES